MTTLSATLPVFQATVTVNNDDVAVDPPMGSMVKARLNFVGVLGVPLLMLLIGV
jgi:hypothetical protein